MQRRKQVEAEHLGRAVFDPSYAHEDDLTHEDLGLDDLHDPTESVIQNRLREVCWGGASASRRAERAAAAASPVPCARHGA